MYSDVMNCDTRAVLPTPASPKVTTRYLGTSTSLVESNESEPTLWYPEPQQEPSKGDRSPDTFDLDQRSQIKLSHTVALLRWRRSSNTDNLHTRCQMSILCSGKRRVTFVPLTFQTLTTVTLVCLQLSNFDFAIYRELSFFPKILHVT